MKRILVMFILGLLVMNAAVEAWAQDTPAFASLKLGRSMITPTFKYDFQYTDNVFREADHEKSDSFHVLSPGIQMRYAGVRPENYIAAGYDGDFAFYSDLTDNNWQRHKPYAAFGYASPLGLYLQGQADYTYSEDPFGTFNEYNQSNQYGLGEKTRRWEGNGRLLLGYRFAGRYALEGYYDSYRIRYDAARDYWQDRVDDQWGAALLYHLTPKSSLLGAFERTGSSYDRQDDGVYDQLRQYTWSGSSSQDNSQTRFWLGARVRPGGKLSGEARIGYGQMVFDNGYDPAGRPYKDWGGLVVSALVSYRPGPRTQFDLNLQRSPLGAPDEESAMFVNTLVALSWRQAVWHRLFFRLSGQWNYDDYQDVRAGKPEKNFNRYAVGANLGWALRPWLKLALTYDYEEKIASDSYYDSLTYHANTIGLLLQIND